MIPPLTLATAEVHAASPGIAEQFGLDWRYVLIQALSFLIIAGVLYWFGIKPTVAAMDERNRKIDAGLKHAEEMKARLEAAQQESAALLRKAQLEGAKVVEEARKSAKDFFDKQTKEAIDHAGDLFAKAQQAIELERRKMLDEARGEIARLVVATTRRVLAKELSDAERSRYNEAASREITVI